MKVVEKSLLELGVPQSDLTIHRNDLLYNGKKFLGSEVIIRNNQCSIDFMITLFYKPEEKIFRRLTGKYALKRQITGIIEETNLFSKDQFIDIFLNNLKSYIAAL
jgi:lipoate-protein ligase A